MGYRSKTFDSNLCLNKSSKKIEMRGKITLLIAEKPLVWLLAEFEGDVLVALGNLNFDVLVFPYHLMNDVDVAQRRVDILILLLVLLLRLPIVGSSGLSFLVG